MGIFDKRQRIKSTSQSMSTSTPMPCSTGAQALIRPSTAPSSRKVDSFNGLLQSRDNSTGEVVLRSSQVRNGQADLEKWAVTQTAEHAGLTDLSLAQQLSQYDAKQSLRDIVGDEFSQIITLIDEDSYHGPDRDFIIKIPSPTTSEENLSLSPPTATRAVVSFATPRSRVKKKPPAHQQLTNSSRSINFFSKVSHYSNSRLPPSLPLLRVYLSTWPLFCLAAQYSTSVYRDPNPMPRVDTSMFVPSNAMLGTKAMVISSHPCDSQRTIVFAIRGTSVLSLRDWNTNLHHTPTSPANFLDDEGNLCHAGFLRVAKAMVLPIAIRLRQLLEQNPSRATCSLLITGHSAGGAVAALIYSHMLSQHVQSDLTILASCFKRVHCITFGAPPISLLPLSKPDISSASLRIGQKPTHNMNKCLFHSFINEGDPVVRAEKSYIKSLIDLVTSQVPPTRENLKMVGSGIVMGTLPNISRLDLNLNELGAQMIGESKKKLKKMTSRPAIGGGQNSPHPSQKPHRADIPTFPQPGFSAQAVGNGNGNGNHDSHHYRLRPTWTLPPSTLSNAGRLIVLRVPAMPDVTRSKNAVVPSTNAIKKHEFETVRAEVVTDDQLRQVVFGDPLMHAMEVYRRRVEALAMRAVTADVGV